MAITVNQSPTFPNGTYTNLLYAVSSNESTAPQYQYVMDVKQGGNLLARVRQYPNPAGDAIFDPSRIMNDYLEYDPLFTDINQDDALVYTQAVQSFDIFFGEEFGTSISSSVDLYNGLGGFGNPAVPGGGSGKVFPVSIDPNNGVSYNWQPKTLLSNRPLRTTIATNEYAWVPIYRNTSFQPVARVYNSSGGILRNKSYSGTLAGSFYQIPISPYAVFNDPNFDDNYPTWDYLELDFESGVDNIRVYREDCTNYQSIGFNFINRYGLWETFYTRLPINKTTSIKRQTLVKPFVDWSSTTSPYDITSRGKAAYNTSYEDNHRVSTNWLSQEEAEWLTELMESPSVFIDNTGFRGQAIAPQWEPIIITNSNYIHNTNLRGQKLFQYEIEWQYSNIRMAR